MESKGNTDMKTTFTSEKRNWRSHVTIMVYGLLISNLFLASTAHAYVDPGSGSVIVTTVLGLLAAIGYTFRKYYYKLKRMYFGDTVKDDNHTEKG